MESVRKEIGVDWLGITGPGSCSQAVFDTLSNHSNPSDWDHRGHGHGYASCAFLPCGVRFFTGRTDGSDRFQLQVSGAACELFGAAAVHDLGRIAMMGGSCTRLDLRCDHFGSEISLLDDLMGSVDRLELRRVHQSHRINTLSVRGEVVGLTQYLGSFGSARFVRVYDKGLETASRPARCWIRWEAQLRSEFAHKAACDIFSADLSDLPSIALSHAYDSVDFRVGSFDERSDRLPMPHWWRDLLADVTLADVHLEPRDVTLASWVAAVQRQYGQVMVLAAHQAGCSVADLAEFVLNGVEYSDGTQKNPIAPALAAAFMRSRSH